MTREEFENLERGRVVRLFGVSLRLDSSWHRERTLTAFRQIPPYQIHVESDDSRIERMVLS